MILQILQLKIPQQMRHPHQITKLLLINLTQQQILQRMLQTRLKIMKLIMILSILIILGVMRRMGQQQILLLTQQLLMIHQQIKQ